MKARTLSRIVGYTDKWDVDSDKAAKFIGGRDVDPSHTDTLDNIPVQVYMWNGNSRPGVWANIFDSAWVDPGLLLYIYIWLYMY